MDMDKNLYGLLFAVHQPRSFVLNPKGLFNLQLEFIPGFGDNNFVEYRHHIYRTRKHRHVGLEDNPQKQHKCAKNIDFSIEECIDQYYQTESNCTISGSTVLHCISENNLGKYVQLVNKTWNLKERDFTRSTNCQVPCTTEYYEVALIREKAVKIEKDYGTLEFQLMITTEKIINSNELLLYDNNNLIADVGGYLGLLLGVSVFSLYQKIMSYFEGIRVNMLGQ